MDNYDKFLANEPLTEENERVRQGLIDVPVEPTKTVAKAPILDVERELMRRERQELKEIRLTDGWKVLERIQEKLSQRAEKSAISMSQVDPFKNREEIANRWAYAGMVKQAMLMLRAEVDREMAELDKEDGR